MAEGDLSDAQRVGRRGAQDRIARRAELGDVLFILSSEQGRRFFWRLLKLGRLFESSFTGNNTTFFNEGKREAILPLLADSQRFPDLYLKMVKENTPPEEKPEDVVMKSEATQEAAAEK